METLTGFLLRCEPNGKEGERRLSVVTAEKFAILALGYLLSKHCQIMLVPLPPVLFGTSCLL